MKTLGLVALVVGLLAATTVASPVVAALLGHGFKFSRVYNRVFEVLLVVALALGWRRLGLGGPAEWGFTRAGWRRRLALGLAVGLAGIAIALAVAWAGGGVAPALRYPPLKTVRKALLGLAAAGLVGVGEETLFRGILLRRLVLDLGPRAGTVAATAVYAIVHALRGGRATVTTGPLAGWARTESLFTPLADPLVWPGVAGLFVFGLVLAWTRHRTGSLWPSIGIHAAWVGVFRVGRLFFDIRQRPAWLVGPGWPPLVGGLAGAIAVVATALLVRRAFLRAPARFPP